MKEKLLKTAVFVLIINFAAAFGWWWTYNQIKKEGGGIEILNKEIADADSKQKNIKNLEQTLKSIGDQRVKINSIFADEKSVVRFIEDLEKLALVSGVALEINSASLPAKTDDGGPSFDLAASGEFGRLFKFLSLVEKMNYQIKMDRAGFDLSGKGPWKTSMRLRMLSYRF